MGLVRIGLTCADLTLIPEITVGRGREETEAQKPRSVANIPHTLPHPALDD